MRKEWYNIEGRGGLRIPVSALMSRVCIGIELQCVAGTPAPTHLGGHTCAARHRGSQSRLASRVCAQLKHTSTKHTSTTAKNVPAGHEELGLNVSSLIKANKHIPGLKINSRLKDATNLLVPGYAHLPGLTLRGGEG